MPTSGLSKPEVRRGLNTRSTYAGAARSGCIRQAHPAGYLEPRTIAATARLMGEHIRPIESRRDGARAARGQQQRGGISRDREMTEIVREAEAMTEAFMKSEIERMAREFYPRLRQIC